MGGRKLMLDNKKPCLAFPVMDDVRCFPRNFGRHASTPVGTRTRTEEVELVVELVVDSSLKHIVAGSFCMPFSRLASVVSKQP